MPWTTPETFTAGQTLTAASMNALSGNDGFLYKPPMCVLQRTTSQTISHNTETVVQYGTAAVDTNSMATTGASAKITIKTAGVYQVSMQTAWTSVAATFQRAAWVKWTSGATIKRIAPFDGKVTDGGPALSSSTLVSLSVNDTLEGFVYHDRGTNLDLALYGGAGGFASVLTAAWIGNPA